MTFSVLQDKGDSVSISYISVTKFLLDGIGQKCILTFMLYDRIQFSNSDRNLGELARNRVILMAEPIVQSWVFVKPHLSLAFGIDSDQLLTRLNRPELLLDSLEPSERSDENGECLLLGEVVELL